MSLPSIGGPVQPGNVTPTIKVGKVLGVPLLPMVADRITRVVVDTHLHLPDMFEIWFDDQEGTCVSDANLSIGTEVEIIGGAFSGLTSTTLIKGEVTSIEGVYENMSVLTVVRGYEKAHRLQRARRSRTFINMTDANIARQVANDAGLTPGTIEATTTTHDHIAQVAQTDWDFLTERAREIGFEWGVAEGKFYFRRASGMPAGGLGGALASAASAVAGALGLGNTLTFKDNLVAFYPRLSGANLTPDVEVRFWDSKGARVVSSKTDAKTGTADLDDDDPKALANSFTDGLVALPSIPSLPKIPGLPMPDFGSTPSNTAYVVVNRPLASGAAADRAADEMAKSVADHMSSTFAEADGIAIGDPDIQAGEQVTIDGVPDPFNGKWTVTEAKHVFDTTEYGYRTHFTVSGRSNRSLLGLTSAKEHGNAPAGFEGLVCGVVTDVNDPLKRGRVKVSLPWLSPSFVTDWARVAQLGAGSKSGAMFLPEVSDEVLVGFEFGDVRRPYVIGGLVNDNSKFSTLTKAVKATGATAAVIGRGIATPAGNQLLFHDELPPGPPGLPPTVSEITLGTSDGNIGLLIDQVSGQLTINCKPAPPASKTPAGTLTIDCSGAGQIAIKGGAGGIKIESDGELELSGKLGVKLTSPANVQVQGAMVQLN